MWVVDMNTFEIRAESNAQTPASRKRKAAVAESEASSTPKQARRNRSPAVNGTCAPDQLLCRYANKKCLNPRDVKRSGGLHTFCAMHRANANRNQRRLDMRKRMERQQQQQQQQQTQRTISGGNTSGSSSDDGTAYSPRVAPIQIPQVDIDALYEPLATPTPLEEEDVSTLVTLFLSDSFILANGGPSPLSHREEQTIGDLLDAALSV